MKIIKSLNVGFNKINRMLIILAGAIIIIDALAVAIDITMRYLIRKSWGGISELTEYSLVWITFLGTTMLLKKYGHVRMDVVPTLLNQRRRAIANIVAYGISTIPIGLAFWYTTKLVLEHYQTNQLFASFLELPRWPFEIIMPIGSLMLFIQVLINIFNLLENRKTLSTGEKQQTERVVP